MMREHIRVMEFFIMMFFLSFVLPVNVKAEVLEEGESYFFGTYEQDKSKPGSEPIEWVVLKTDENSALLVSRYALDYKKFDDDNADATWVTCSLREWLNNEFLNKAFTEEEQLAIFKLEQSNDASQGNEKWDERSLSNTDDMVFLLSYKEIKEFFSSSDLRKLKPTAYSAAKGDAFRFIDFLFINEVGWWTRSPGKSDGTQCYIEKNGIADSRKVKEYASIRPAVWIDTEIASIASRYVQYNSAIESMTNGISQGNIGDVHQAEMIFEKLGDYEESLAYAENCKEAIHNMTPIDVFEQNQRPLTGVSYELAEGSGYVYQDATPVEMMLYGQEKLGILYSEGETERDTVFDGRTAYGVNQNLSFSYRIDGSFHSDDKNQWNLCGDNADSVSDIHLPRGLIAAEYTGAIIVQKSHDGKEWDVVAKKTDVFTSKSKMDIEIYTTTDEEIKNGTYYRFLIAYKMKRLTGKQSLELIGYAIDPIKVDRNEYREYVEVYDVFVCSEENPVVIRDLVTRTIKSTSLTASVNKGFFIDMQGSENVVSIELESGEVINDPQRSSFTQSGTYNVKVTTKLGKLYEYMISVTDGLAITEVPSKLYEGKKDEGFPTSDEADDLSTYRLTRLKIGQMEGSEATHSVLDGINAYGIRSDGVSIFIELTDEKVKEEGWRLISDPWGKSNTQLVNGVVTGEIGTGALIIQKSEDGVTWEEADHGAYASGLYTTDLYNLYGDRNDILIYLPNGDDVLNGIYLRILYAYQLQSVENEKDYKDCVEEYKFYLCSNELDAVTFHNMTINGNLEEYFGDADENTLQVLHKAETLLDGSCTTTGFIVDTSLNPTVTYSVRRDDSQIEVTDDHKYTATGRYTIILKSAVEDIKEVTIYVDRQDSADSLTTYFGDSFIQGKRLYSEGDYPLYEGGFTSYHIAGISDDFLPIGGIIQNTTTGEIIEIASSREERTDIINSPGEYMAVFQTGMNMNESSPSGDIRVFQFHFIIAPEGSAPGPQINQENLIEYNRSNVSGSYPLYYGVTFQSA